MTHSMRLRFLALNK
ncbi:MULTISPECIES: erythromycin resistance leader peptide [Bacillaceae]|uniref:Erythromycin resistance leader peptide n=2 Tax=Niallia TaxID=2837506 RepID=A0A941GEC7_NIACI|nr:erythromycin resistance leader peptide [Niallia circulans]MBQ6447168.1 erythromycin resistance leader peptide [Bacillus sp. (in: firmicutes)]MBZ9535735.1 erythromycin resistance leader peptide [Cytobacillus oceanisediminis]NMO78351.1 erythromycin resistance leader peptide [Niallia alba]HEO8418750.1 erythromycin resistance leader peptide [Yersinia enterocolitica]MCB5239905.1 erythromycin resistance leader peptide [Niallia circulans]